MGATKARHPSTPPLREQVPEEESEGAPYVLSAGALQKRCGLVPLLRGRLGLGLGLGSHFSEAG